jgi:WD40 repeat protein
MGAIWTADTSNIKVNHQVVFNLLQKKITCSAFSHDGLMIATGSIDGTVKIWKTGTDTLLTELKGHKDTITSVSFSTGDSFIYTGSINRTFRQWRVPDKENRTSWNMKLSFDELFSKGIIDSVPEPVTNTTTKK